MLNNLKVKKALCKHVLGGLPFEYLSKFLQINAQISLGNTF